MDLASHLHKSLQETKQQTTSSEFVLWTAYLREAPNRFNPLYHYLAQIAYEVRLSGAWVRKTSRFKLKDFLLKFTWAKPVKKSLAPLTEEQKKKHIATSQAFWIALTKIGKKNKGK